MVQTALLLGYYLFMLFGSISLGYLVLRLTYPEIRTFQGSRKLAASFLLGIIMAITALVLDYLVYKDAVLSLTSSTAFFLLVAMLFYFLAMRLYAATRANKQRYITVGIPVTQKKTPAGEDLQRRIQSVKQRIEKVEQVSPPGGMPLTAEVPRFLHKEKEKELKRLKEEEEKLKVEQQRREKVKNAKQKETPHVEVTVSVKKADLVTWRNRGAGVGGGEKDELATQLQVPAAEAKQQKGAVKTKGEKKEENGENIEEEIDTLMGPEKKKAMQQLQSQAKSGAKAARTEQAEEAEPMHRRYLHPGEVKVIAPKHVAESEEFNQLVQDVYTQLETTKKDRKVTDIMTPDAPKQREEIMGKTAEKISENTAEKKLSPSETRQLKKLEEKKEISQVAPQQAKPEMGVSISDILGGTDLFAKPAEGNEGKEGRETREEKETTETGSALATTTSGQDIFGKLSEISGTKEVKESKEEKKGKRQTEEAEANQESEENAGRETRKGEKQKPEKPNRSVELVKMEAEKGVGCPTCHSSNSKIIFCPYCGAGMCANCSPSIKPLGDGNFVYTCPKCGEEVNVKRK